ncbi:hypothetical protein ACH5RR_013639 [Cinchona calisaya]|uniref:Zinc finger PMZ-type domain-containing protein n=1 Tax=Cinchona calisaya TaxID=153742 RepID=A0ABD3A0P6_9GENT
MYELLPDAEHRMCLRHMYNNFKKVHSGLALKDWIWAAAKATTVNKFTFLMESLKEFDEGAFKWPVLKLFEKTKEAASACIPTHAADWKYEIRCIYGDRHTVDLVARTYSCRKWDLNSIPCAHAVSAIVDTGEDPQNFIHTCYSKEAYMRAYEPIIIPLNGDDLWVDQKQPPVLPPVAIKLPGRTKKVRKREPDKPEKGKNPKKAQKMSRVGLMAYKCKICKNGGHNSRRCPDRTSNEQADSETVGDGQTENVHQAESELNGTFTNMNTAENMHQQQPEVHVNRTISSEHPSVEPSIVNPIICSQSPILEPSVVANPTADSQTAISEQIESDDQFDLIPKHVFFDLFNAYSQPNMASHQGDSSSTIQADEITGQ